MSQPRPADPATAGRFLRGTTSLLASEAIGLPAGLATVAVLARKLDQPNFAGYSVAFACASFGELLILAFVGRFAVKLIGEAPSWRDVGDEVARRYLLAGALAALVLGGAAPMMARTLAIPGLATALPLFAVGLVPFALVRAHRDLLLGPDQLHHRAAATAIGAIGRALLTIAIVLVWPSIAAPAVATIGACLIELVYCRRLVHPRLGWRAPPGTADVPLGLPVALIAIVEIGIARVDIVLLRWLGTTTEVVSLFGGAQRLAFVPGMLTAAVSGPLLAALGRLGRDAPIEARAATASQAIRAIILMAPFAALGAGAAGGVLRVLLGPEFGSAALVLQLLVWAAFARILAVLAAVVLVAADRGAGAAPLSILILCLTLALHLTLIPGHSAAGAAGATLIGSVALALGLLSVARRAWPLVIPIGTVVRAAGISVAAFLGARLLPDSGPAAVAGWIGIGLAIPAAWLLVGELRAADRASLRAAFGRGGR